MKLLNWFKLVPNDSNKIKPIQRSSYDKNIFLYKLFTERDQIEILENVYARPSLNLTEEEMKILNKIQKFYWLKEKKHAYPYQIIRVKFKNKIFDIINQGRFYQIYEPTTNTLRSNINEEGQHTGQIIDSDLFKSYIGIAFKIVKNELEKPLFGDDNIRLIFNQDSEGNINSIETDNFILNAN